MTVGLSTLAARLRAAPTALPPPDPFGHRGPYDTDTEEIVAGCAKNLAYSDVRRLAHAVAEYGPGIRTTPAYPFHHLVSDGVWEVRTERGPGSPGTEVRELRATGAAGRLTPELRAALRQEPPLLRRLTRVLPGPNFPPSLHGELCEAVGLELEEAETGQLSAARRQRDRRIRGA